MAGRTGNPMNPKSTTRFRDLGEAALSDVETVLSRLTDELRAECVIGGRLDSRRFGKFQYAAHGLAWFATYIEGMRRLLDWAAALDARGQFGDTEALILRIAFGEYLAQLSGGLVMSQGEIVRAADFGLAGESAAPLAGAAVRQCIAEGNTDSARAELCALMLSSEGAATIGAPALSEELDMVREQFRRFANDRIVPRAHRWHLDDELIPMEIIREMADLGVFGLTIPEDYGGLGLSKTAMCVVSEELSRGYIGVGSLGTRSEIAAELVLCGGTDGQKRRFLPGLASGEALPTAVFTEPDTGSDLGALRTRAERVGDDYLVSGSKTWITHAARANLMTLMARTDPATADHRGLSMFLAEKSPGTTEDPFPDAGISGSEIRVLGYRGMKEYEIGFDGFRVHRDCLLGGGEGNGFRQLMTTFESARIQTAARAVGVAQSALETALRYAEVRRQFGRPLVEFPRIYAKLAMMAAEIMVARQLTYHAAREKDAGRRCDRQAGMAKLLAARVAWSAADNGVQIHGGNGFAEEYPISRILCDARILSIFEGTAEIQAQVIARRLLLD